MALPVDLNPHWLASSAGYEIERSLRFNSADSAYLNRTPSSAPSNADIGTWSFWVKRTKLGVEEYVFGARDGGNLVYTGIRFTSGDAFEFTMANGGSPIARRITTQVFRDPSAWAHFVIVYNSPLATASERVRIYVNGVEITAFSTSVNPSQNQDLIRWAANGVPNYIGNEGTTLGNYGDYYLTEVNYLDGQVPTTTTRTVNGVTETILTQLGEFSSSTGVWTPKAWDGTYGTNGFYLKFADNSNTTAATLGKDSSGNGNNWTPNNFSVTAGAGNDSLVDTPTSYGTDTGVGGEVRGNYCTMNPLQYSSTYVTLSNGNLNVTGSSGVDAGGAFGTAKVNSGKWYWEATIVAAGASYPAIGFAVNTTGTQYQGGARIGPAGTLAIASPESFITLNGSPSGTSFTTNDVLQFALDMDNGKMWIGKNGTWMNSGVPASGTGNVFSISDRTQFVSPFIFSYNSSQVAYNFGQRAFAYTAPSGFKALCTQNLPPVDIGATSTTQASDYFNVLTYTGNGTDGRTVTGVGFNPDLVWVKGRSDTGAHVWADAVRGSNKNIYSNLTDAETDPTSGASGGGIGTVTTDGFVLEQGSVNMDLVNTNARTYVAWNWNAGGSTVTNTSGTISSQVRASTTSGFSIVTGTLGAAGVQNTVGHGLNAVPNMILFKTRSGATYNWSVFHTSISTDTTKYLRLNDNSATLTYSTVWGAALPTSTVFGVTGDGCGSPSNPFVAYCFAPVAGYSAFGSYTGNGAADGPFVYTGFRPAFFMFKRTDTATGTLANSWAIKTAIIPGYNENRSFLAAASSNAEDTNGFGVDFLANGVKLRLTAVDGNASGGKYIYAAFAESPFKYSLAR